MPFADATEASARPKSDNKVIQPIETTKVKRSRRTAKIDLTITSEKYSCGKLEKIIAI